MKYWIGFAVVGVHVVLLGVFLGPWTSRGSRSSGRAAVTTDPASHPDTSPAPLASGGPPAALPSPVPSSPRPPGSPSAGPTLGSSTATAAVTRAERASPNAGVKRLSPSLLVNSVRPLPAKLQAATASCRTGVLVDWSARQVLWGKAETRVVPIASLTKMMTILVVMQDLSAGATLDLNTPIQVTREAALVGGRQVWLDPRETFPLQDIVRCALIHSANDAAFLLAQTLAGSQNEFVMRMRERAVALGLTSFTFHNAHGLPEGPTQQENSGSALDLACLAGALLNYPKIVEWSSTRLSYLEPRVDGTKTQLLNTNHLVGRVQGVNGMKTGFTDKAGYCLAATCERNGRQVIAIATGCPRSSERDGLVTALIEWAYTTP